MLLPFSDVCLDWPAFELTGGSPAGGVYSGSGVTNGWFDPAVAGLGTHEITYTYTASNGCDNSAMQSVFVDPCTGIDEFGEGAMSIFPNPSTGKFELKLYENGPVAISVFNILGKEVYRNQVVATGKLIQTIYLENNEKGIYLIKVQTDNGNYIKKLKLID